jgi:micrococcal nuclease
VLIDGRDLGETLIAEGVARPWRGRREPWCDAGGNLIP